MSVYEVRCHDCDVSFAPGTKRCIHCGNRIRPRQSANESLLERKLKELTSADEIDLDELAAEGATGTHPPEVVDDEAPTSSLPRLLTGLSWLILVAIVSIYRACTEGGG